MSHTHSVFRSVHVSATKYVNKKRGRKENVDHFWSSYFRIMLREWVNIFEFKIKRKMFICQCTYWYHLDKWFQFLCMYSVYGKNRSWGVNIYCFWWIKVSLQWLGLEVVVSLLFFFYLHVMQHQLYLSPPPPPLNNNTNKTMVNTWLSN